MRKIFLFSAIVCACFIGTNNANAQGFLNKVKKATDKVTQTAAAVTGSDDSGSSPSINVVPVVNPARTTSPESVAFVNIWVLLRDFSPLKGIPLGSISP